MAPSAQFSYLIVVSFCLNVIDIFYILSLLPWKCALQFESTFCVGLKMCVSKLYPNKTLSLLTEQNHPATELRIVLIGGQYNDSL